MCSYITENLLLLHMTNNLIQYKIPNNLLSRKFCWFFHTLLTFDIAEEPEVGPIFVFS